MAGTEPLTPPWQQSHPTIVQGASWRTDAAQLKREIRASLERYAPESPTMSASSSIAAGDRSSDLRHGPACAASTVRPTGARGPLDRGGAAVSGGDSVQQAQVGNRPQYSQAEESRPAAASTASSASGVRTRDLLASTGVPNRPTAEAEDGSVSMLKEQVRSNAARPRPPNKPTQDWECPTPPLRAHARFENYGV
eukprot:COSAG05_NODE_398_length_10293_cov_11.919176_12_plen_195_part_00